MENATEQIHIRETVDFNFMAQNVDNIGKGFLMQLQKDLGFEFCHLVLKDILE